jgi:hypothetical protein
LPPALGTDERPARLHDLQLFGGAGLVAVRTRIAHGPLSPADWATMAPVDRLVLTDDADNSVSRVQFGRRDHRRTISSTQATNPSSQRASPMHAPST